MSFNFLLHITMEHTQESHQKKRFNEEETLDKAEKKIDDVMGKITNKGNKFTQKVLTNKIFKDIINFHMVTDANHKIQPHLKTIFMVIG